MWCSWCVKEAQGRTAAPFSSPAHFRNCYPAPTALALNRIPRDDGRRQKLLSCFLELLSREWTPFSPLREIAGTEDSRMDSLRRTKSAIIAVGLLLTVSVSVASAPPKKTSASSHPSSKTHKVSRHATKKSRKPRGQQAIDGERTRQIQEALVREHYMTGEPSGKWDEATQQAMRRYQAEQGWQSKSIPDSRALIRMGLGPDHVHLLNPESAMVSEPQLSGRTRTATPVAARPAVPARPVTPVAVPATTVPDISPSR